MMWSLWSEICLVKQPPMENKGQNHISWNCSVAKVLSMQGTRLVGIVEVFLDLARAARVYWSRSCGSYAFFCLHMGWHLYAPLDLSVWHIKLQSLWPFSMSALKRIPGSTHRQIVVEWKWMEWYIMMIFWRMRCLAKRWPKRICTLVFVIW